MGSTAREWGQGNPQKFQLMAIGYTIYPSDTKYWVRMRRLETGILEPGYYSIKRTELTKLDHREI